MIDFFSFPPIGLPASPIPTASYISRISTSDISQSTSGSSIQRRRSLNQIQTPSEVTETKTNVMKSGLSIRSTAKSSLSGISRFAASKMVIRQFMKYFVILLIFFIKNIIYKFFVISCNFRRTLA